MDFSLCDSAHLGDPSENEKDFLFVYTDNVKKGLKL